MPNETADVVICGAGIAGITSAYHLTRQLGVGKVLLVDERPPMSLTSDKSTECYRNWWPGPGSAMVDLMNRSIDLLEDWADHSGNVMRLNRRGYLFATARREQGRTYQEIGREISALGAGPLRTHTGSPDDPTYHPSLPTGYHDQPTGADLFLDPGLIQEHFPFLSDEVRAALHVRRAGWFSAQQMGGYLLKEATRAGAQTMTARVESIKSKGGRVSSVGLSTANGAIDVATECVVLAAGPKLNTAAEMLGLSLPIYSELHTKVSFADRVGAVPREAGLLIWSDPVQLPWTHQESRELQADPETAWLVDTLPAGVHARPEGADDSPIVLLLWTYETEPVTPVFPPPIDAQVYPEVAIRGFSRMVPAMEAYFNRLPKPFVDGGYYTKTRENRPLIGPLQVEGSYVIGALSGYGLMASPAAGELLAAHVAGSQLPEWERWFRVERYQDPDYQKVLDSWGSTGQL